MTTTDDDRAERLPVGTRIRFTKTLECGPTGDHPAFLYARKGEYGAVTGHSDVKGLHRVTWDGWPTPFTATFGEEFEEVT